MSLEETKNPESHQDDERPEVNLTELGSLHTKGDAYAEAISPAVFQTGGKLTRVNRPDGRPKIEPLNLDALAGIVSRHVKTIETKATKKGPQDYERHPPKDVLAELLSRGDWPNIRPIDGIAGHPVLSPTGEIITQNGYNAKTRLWLEMAPELTEINIPDKPSEQDIEQARTVFFNWLVDFPFDGDADRAAVIAALLTVIVRPAIAGPIPYLLVSAPAPGTGKTLIAVILSLVLSGELPPLVGETKDPTELKKAVEAVLMNAPEIVVLDNINSRVDWGFLAGIISSMRWQVRRLGYSEMIEMAVLALFIMTANNPILSNEMARRGIVARLVPETERPWQREGFKHPDIRAYTLENRASIIKAALTLTRAWQASGQPVPSSKPLGSFEAWHKVVGGILEFAGIPGLLANLDNLMDTADTETASWTAFVEDWHRTHGESLTRVSELVELALKSNVIEEGRTSRGTQTALGKALARMADRIYCGKKIHRGAVVAGVQFWQLVAIEKSVGLDRPCRPISTLTREEENNSLCIDGKKQVPKVLQVLQDPDHDNPWGGMF